MILKLVLPTICLILLIHPVISDIDNQWAKKVSDFTKKLIELAEVFVDPSESVPFRSAYPLKAECPLHQSCVPFQKCLSTRRLLSQIFSEKNSAKKVTLINEKNFSKCGNHEKDHTVCCDQWHFPERCVPEKLQQSNTDLSGPPQPQYGYCGLPNTIDIDGQGGVAKSLMDCHVENLNKFEEPPHSVLTLKGGYPMICCPKDDGRPQNSIFSSETIRVCTDDEIYDYYDDPDSVDCEPPLDDSPKFEYVYNWASNCPEGTKCTNGNTCGVKDFNNTTPPESCGFDLTTGEDKFCCTDLGPNSQLVNEPQKPLFKPERHDRTAYPCMDYTSKCEEWTRYYPEHCSPDYTLSGYSVNRYPFMREVCQESCRKIQESQGAPGYFSRAKSVRSNKCENGCVDEYELCPQWSRLGFCHNKPQFMNFNCRESCGSCGFKSPNNRENQVVNGKQFTDISSKEDFMCGKNKLKNPLDEKIKQIIEEGQVAANEDFKMCTNVLISDRFALTSAACIEPIDPQKNTRVVKIRDGTDDEELIGVRRVWGHPYRSKVKFHGSQEPVYYDIAIMELERRIIYNYAKYGDSPICIGEELAIPSQNVVTQGFGKTPDDNIGELLQLELKVLTSDECYEKFNNIPEDQQKIFNASLRYQVTGNLHEGITDQVLCTAITCDGSDLNLDNWDKCDVGQGDAGAPLFTFDKVLSTPEEQVGQTLIAIHSGGDDSLSGRCVKKENCHFYPKWWTKVAAFSEWINCTQKYARKGLTASNVEDVCDDKGFVFGFPPKCDHKALFFDNEKPCSCHNPIIFPDDPILRSLEG